MGSPIGNVIIPLVTVTEWGVNPNNVVTSFASHHFDPPLRRFKRKVPKDHQMVMKHMVASREDTNKRHLRQNHVCVYIYIYELYIYRPRFLHHFAVNIFHIYYVHIYVIIYIYIYTYILAVHVLWSKHMQNNVSFVTSHLDTVIFAGRTPSQSPPGG